MPEARNEPRVSIPEMLTLRHEGSEVTPGPLNQNVLGAHVNDGNTGDSNQGDPPSPREASKAPCETVKH